MAVGAFQERELVDRRARGFQGAGRAAVERHAEHGRTAATARGPHIHGLARHIEHAAGRAHHGARFAAHLAAGQVAAGDGMQGQAGAGRDLFIGAIDARGRRDALEVLRHRLGTPAAQRGKAAERIAAAHIHRQRRIEHQFGADQAARIIARRIIVVRAQMIGGAVGQAAGGIDIEQAHFRAAAAVAVADHHHGVARDQHLVVPAAGRIAARRKRVDRRHRPQCLPVHVDGEQLAAPEHYQMLAMHLDDAAFVDAGRLGIGDRFICRDGNRAGHLARFRRRRFGHRRRHGRRHGRRFCHGLNLGAPQPLDFFLLREQLVQVGRQRLFAGKRGQGLARRRVGGGSGGMRGERQ